MKEYLFLDDFRSPRLVLQYDPLKIERAPYAKEDLWDVVINYDDFTYYVEEYYKKNNRLPKLISFDHDLADEDYSQAMFTNPDRYNGYYENKFVEKTGYDCAKWLIDFCMDHEQQLPICLVHSQNPVGRENIEKLTDNFKSFQEKNK